MRISDWSSDVCSSDLSASVAQAAEANAEASATAAAGSAAQVENAKMIWQGDWSAGTYQVNDAVAHVGASWIATVETDRTSVVLGKRVTGRVNLGGLQSRNSKMQRARTKDRTNV